MRCALAVLATTLLSMPCVADTVTYTYTGNPFTLFQGVGETQIYTANDFVSGEFTLSAPLAANITNYQLIHPDSFSFSDGIETITNSSPGSNTNGTEFRVNTDATGSITEWVVFTTTTDPSGATWEIDTENIPGVGAIFDSTDANSYDTGTTTCVNGNCDAEVFNYLLVQNGNAAGTWSDNVPVAPTPEPSSLWLAATGIAGAAALIRRRVAPGQAASFHFNR
jgi:MYXO-CTERM domain-containing protein